MKPIIDKDNFNNEISLINARKKHKAYKEKKPIDKPFRVYTVNDKDYTAKGYWIENNIIFKDKIKFIKFRTYKIAKIEAERILKITKEVCIAIEDIKKNILYIVYRDKTQVLRVKYSYKTICKRKAIKRIKDLTVKNGGSTLEIKEKMYIITSYK